MQRSEPLLHFLDVLCSCVVKRRVSMQAKVHPNMRDCQLYNIGYCNALIQGKYALKLSIIDYQLLRLVLSIDINM